MEFIFLILSVDLHENRLYVTDVYHVNKELKEKKGKFYFLRFSQKVNITMETIPFSYVGSVKDRQHRAAADSR